LNMVICPEIWICPSCGSRVQMPVSSFGEAGVFPEQLCDRLARCMCACYVRSLPDTRVGLLLASLLSAGEDEECSDGEIVTAGGGAASSPAPAA
jgi:hypothetical protein